MEQSGLHKPQWLEFDLPKASHIFIYNFPLAKFVKLNNKENGKSSEFLGLSLNEEQGHYFPCWWWYQTELQT